jgi:hypothetical protein
MLNYFFNYLALYAKYFIVVILLSMGFVLPFSFFTGNSILYSWEWVHHELIVGYLWYFGPIFTIFILILISGKFKKNKFFDLDFYPYYFHFFSFFVFASIFIGSLSQVFGGCVWQLPVILAGWEGYAWERFGSETFDTNLLLVGYSIITIVYGYLIHIYGILSGLMQEK